jgi:hypothetical protein
VYAVLEEMTAAVRALKHFQEHVLPLHEKVGLPVIATYVNRPQNEFIWVRTFADETDRDAKQKAFQDAGRRRYRAWPQRRENGDPRGRTGIRLGSSCLEGQTSGSSLGPPFTAASLILHTANSAAK